MQMGTRDHKRQPRPTRRFNSPALVAATKSGDEPAVPVPSTGRTTTLHDPFTTELLAEVERRSRTLDLDDEQIEEVLDAIDVGETAHPHTRRRPPT